MNNQIKIRVSKFEIAAPGMFGQTPFKFDFAKMSISEILPNKQKFIQNTKISLKFTAKLISAHQNFAKLTPKFLEPPCCWFLS